MENKPGPENIKLILIISNKNLANPFSILIPLIFKTIASITISSTISGVII